MIRHIVLIQFKPDVSENTIAGLFDELAAVRKQLPGIIDASAGRSESPEKMERGHMHGFVVDLTDWAALQTYQDHPDHQTLGAKLVANAVGGKDGILVFDYEIT